MTLLLLGIFVTLFPMILSMLFARYVLGYRNAALLAGAVAGSRGASPAFDQVIDKSESSVATVPFAVTYALGAVLLALLGPIRYSGNHVDPAIDLHTRFRHRGAEAD